MVSSKKTTISIDLLFCLCNKIVKIIFEHTISQDGKIFKFEVMVIFGNVEGGPWFYLQDFKLILVIKSHLNYNALILYFLLIKI